MKENYGGVDPANLALSALLLGFGLAHVTNYVTYSASPKIYDIWRIDLVRLIEDLSDGLYTVHPASLALIASLYLLRDETEKFPAIAGALALILTIVYAVLFALVTATTIIIIKMVKTRASK